jgi:hypothetical protein
MIEIGYMSGVVAAAILCVIALTLIWYKTKGNIRFKLYYSVIIILAIVLATGIYTGISAVTYIPAEQSKSVLVLYDNSSSVQYHNITLTQVMTEVAHLSPEMQLIAQGERSDIVSATLGSLSKDGTILLVSDGYTTDNEDYQRLLESAHAIGTTIYTLKLPSVLDDASVIIQGPEKAYATSSSTYVVSVLGNNKLPGKLEIYFNGVLEKETTIYDKPIIISKQITEDSIIEARLIINDIEPKNNNYFKTTRVIEKPIIGLQANNERLEAYLAQLFTVQKVDTQRLTKLDDSLSALIIANQPASAINMDVISNFVIDGNGLAVLGGANAYDFGGYDTSELGHMLPVTKGKAGERSQAVIVIAIDISASTDGAVAVGSQSRVIEIQKAIAYNLVEQLSEDTLVGVVAFNTEAYLIQELSPLSSARNEILNKIARIQMQGGTRIHMGLGAAYELLQNQYGTSSIILVSDGQLGGGNDGPKTREMSKILAQNGITVYAVGVGSDVQEGTMRQIAKRYRWSLSFSW